MQIWTLKGTSLKTYWCESYYERSSVNCWKPTDGWRFQSKGSLIYIENFSENKVLGVTGNKVILEAKDENKSGQLWIKGEQIYHTYIAKGTYYHFTGFTLRNFESPSKFLTPVGSLSTSGFELKGNINRKEF